MGQLTLQIGDRPGRMTELTKIAGDRTTIGRAFDNDIVIHDPFVDAHQVTLLRDEDDWVIRASDATNPVLLNSQPVNHSGSQLKSGDRLLIGRTQIRIFDESHQVEKTRKILVSSWFDTGKSHPVFALLMVSVVFALTVFTQHQDLHTEVKWKELFSGSLGLILMIVFWAAAWALTGRLLRHQPGFTAQLGFTALLTSALYILIPAVDYATYAFNNVMSGEIVFWLICLAFGYGLLRINLSLATNLKHYSLISFLVSSALLLTMYALVKFNEEPFSTSPDYPAVLKPPFAHVSGARSPAEFIDSYSNLFFTGEK